MIKLKSLITENAQPFAVFVLVPVDGGYAATTRAADRGEGGRIGLPGGKVDAGETPIDALYRESKEEGWEIYNINPDPIQKRVIDGNMIYWYAAQSAKKLNSYKEQHRISNIIASSDQIKQSGYGNDTLILEVNSLVLTEFLELNFKDDFSPEQKQMAVRALKYYIQKEWPYIENAPGKMSNRFNFELVKIRDAWSEIIFTFNYLEKGGKEINMPPYPESPRIERHKYHKDVKSALADIPKNENSVYRGMSFEEALAIKKRGYVMSNSSLTLGDSQEGYTFFGEDPKTALFYASGFQPLPLTGTRNRPPVIIEIPKDYVEPADITINKKTKCPIGRDGEWVSNIPISVDKIANVWFVISKYSSKGDFDIIYDKHNDKFHGGSRAPISIKSVLINKPEFFK